MNPKQVREIQTNKILRQRLAKFIALHCFRNTDVLEDLHSGEVPSSESGDYSDVKVVAPDQEIPWSNLSRLSDREMKALMIDVTNHCDQFLGILFSTPAGDSLIEELGRRDLVPHWNDPAWSWTMNLRQFARGSRRLTAKRKAKRTRPNARARSAGKK